MAIKDKVLMHLQENTGNSVSGEQLAESLGVSRTAVWKAINSLRNEGYLIEAVTNKGYRLDAASNVLSKSAIADFSSRLDTDLIYVFDSIDSTNIKAKELASKGLPHGTLVTADTQTKGRGRLGRSFFSPAGSGIYMSLVLRPDISLDKATHITTAAAAAVSMAIERVCGIVTGIKWVNDIYIGESKLCGILTEAVTDFESGSLESVVVGIGINYKNASEIFPEDVLARKICWLYEKDEGEQTSRNEIIAAVCDEILEIVERLDDPSIIDYYKSRSVVLGKDLTCTRGNEVFYARAVDIDSTGGLVVVGEDGQRRVLSSGEVSIRW